MGPQPGLCPTGGRGPTGLEGGELCPWCAHAHTLAHERVTTGVTAQGKGSSEEASPPLPCQPHSPVPLVAATLFTEPRAATATQPALSPACRPLCAVPWLLPEPGSLKVLLLGCVVGCAHSECPLSRQDAAVACFPLPSVTATRLFRRQLPWRRSRVSPAVWAGVGPGVPSLGGGCTSTVSTAPGQRPVSVHGPASHRE